MSTTAIQLDRSIRTALVALRRRIRWYVWLQGLALLTVFVGVAFWMSLGADWFFEPSVAIRRIILAAVALIFATAGYRVIGRRAFVPLPDHSMAILLERRFSEFDAALLTAVELTARPPDPNDCNRALLEATCNAARDPIGRVRLSDVFNLRPLRRALIAAALSAAAAVSFYSLAPDAFSVWLRRTVFLSEELWPRRTVLSVEGFTDGAAQVARGADFTLIVKADTTARLVPQRVRVDYRPEGASWLDATMIREGRAQPGRDRYQVYSYTFRGVLSPINLNLHGGDASIRGLRIEVVDAPTLVKLDAVCQFPGYMNRPPRTISAAGVVPIPRGTKVTLRAEANKRLTLVEIHDGETTRFVARAPVPDLHGLLERQRQLSRAARTSDGTSGISVSQREIADQLQQIHDEVQRRYGGASARKAVAELLTEFDGVRHEMLDVASGTGSLDIVAGDYLAQRLQVLYESLGRMLSSLDFNYILHLTDETKTLEFTLHDIDGIKSNQPIRVTLSVVEDQPPQLTFQLEGIGTAITPQAKLPFRGLVSDDNGVDRVWLEYAVEGREPRSQVLRELQEAATRIPVDDSFDVDSLRLEPGQKFLISVKARDRYDLAPEPNIGSGDRWLLDVVTPEKLRAILEAREIVLRQRFETIVEDIEAIHKTLAGLTFDEESTPTAPESAQKAEPGEPKRVDTAERRRAVRLLRIQRARQNGQKDSHETAGVAEAFADIRQELVNNRIYTEELRIRIEEDIVAPLSRLVTADFVQYDEQLARLESTHDDPEQSPALRDTALHQTDMILKTMREVLSHMVELEDFNEAVQLLRSIIEEQEQLRDAVRDRRKAKLRLLLED